MKNYKEMKKELLRKFQCDLEDLPQVESGHEIDFSDYGEHIHPRPEDLRVQPEMVSHPAHYNHGEYETIDVIEDWSLGFHCGNAIKYISRHKHKGSTVRDIEKAIWYLERYLDTIQD